MNADYSLQQPPCNRKEVVIKLKSGRIVNGIVIGYFKFDSDDNDSKIIRWHIIAAKDRDTLGLDSFGFLIGEMIDTRDIKEIYLK